MQSCLEEFQDLKRLCISGKNCGKSVVLGTDSVCLVRGLSFSKMSLWIAVCSYSA